MGCIKDFITIYKTTRIVQVKSTFLSVTYLILVALVWFAFLTTYSLDPRKIYQKPCPVRGTFTSKVKGVLSTEYIPDEEFVNSINKDMYKRVWDVQDVVYGFNSGFTVITNLVITPSQNLGNCTPSSYKDSKHCLIDKDCEKYKGQPDNGTIGIFNGKCTYESKCELSTWCPIENDRLPLGTKKALLTDTKHFTVLIKNSVEFPDCEPNLCNCDRDLYKTRNILKNYTGDYLKSCRYDPVHSPYCPIFVLNDIVNGSGFDYDEVAVMGAIFRIRVSWNCDFDWGTIEDCLPKYSFSRVDASDSSISPGFNNRFVRGGNNTRLLLKRYGLLFILENAGEGRRFEFLSAVLSIGASIGLFALAPLFCDSLFDIFCYLQTLGCNACFNSCSPEVRYQEVDYHKQLEKQKEEERKPRTSYNSDLAWSMYDSTRL